MLTNAKSIMNDALKNHYAIPHFNINNLEWTRYILEECENLKSPVILGVSEGAKKYMGGFNTIASMVDALLSDLKITVPVVLHLDHGSSVASCKEALDSGFTSVMYDGSKLSLEENLENTKKVVEYAKYYNASVEAEIGHIGGSEDGITDEMAYAKVEDAVKLGLETNIDLLAPALGSVHGIYKGEPKLDFNRMKEIKEKTDLPLVLHGGSGIPDEMIKTSIEFGICKLNINTELQIAWSNAVRKFLSEDAKVFDPRKIISSGEEAIKKCVREKIELLGSKNKA